MVSCNCAEGGLCCIECCTQPPCQTTGICIDYCDECPEGCIPSETFDAEEIYGVCPYCGYEPPQNYELGDAYCYDCEYIVRASEVSEHADCDLDIMDEEGLRSEMEFWLYENHPDFCEGMRNSLKESETFEAVYDDYIISMKRNNPLSRHYIPPKKKSAAETFEAYNPEQPRDEGGRWISDTPISDEEMQSYITGAQFRRSSKRSSKITLRQLSETLVETTDNHLDFDTAYKLVNQMLAEHPQGDSEETRKALLFTLEETQMQLEYANEIGWDMDLEIMAGLLRSRGIEPPEEYEEAVINRLTFEDEWAAEEKRFRIVKEYDHTITQEQHDEIIDALTDNDPNQNIFSVRYGDTMRIITPYPPINPILNGSFLPTFSAESIGYDKPLGESLNWTPYEYLDSKKIKPNKPTPAKDFDMADTFGRNVLLMSEDEDPEPELKKYMVGVPVLHSYAVGPVEAYNEEEAEDEVRNNWRYWRRTIEDNGDWGGPLWKYSAFGPSSDPEAHEISDAETFESEYEQAIDVSMDCPLCNETMEIIGEGGDMKSDTTMHFEYYCDCDEIIVSPANMDKNWELAKANPCTNCGVRYDINKQEFHPITDKFNKNGTQYWMMCEICHKGFCQGKNADCQTQNFVCNFCEPQAYETFESSNYKCVSCGITFAQEDTRDIDGDIVCDDCVYNIYDIDGMDAESFSQKWEVGDYLTFSEISELISAAQDRGCLVTSYDAREVLDSSHLIDDKDWRNTIIEIYTDYRYTDASKSRFNYEHKFVYDFEFNDEEEMWQLSSLEQPYAVSLAYPYHMEYIVQSTDPEDAADMAVRGEGKRSVDGDLSKYPIFSFPSSVDWEPNSDETRPLFD